MPTGSDNQHSPVYFTETVGAHYHIIGTLMCLIGLTSLSQIFGTDVEQTHIGYSENDTGK